MHAQQRLFGASRDGTLFEINFATKKHVGVIGSGGGAVFCLTSLCPCCSNSNSNKSEKKYKCRGYIAAGCEDGSVRIYKASSPIEDSTSATGTNRPCLQLVSTLPSASLAVTALAWKRGNNDDDYMGGSIIYAGIADGTIRKYQCVSTLQSARASGSSVHAISTGLVLSGDNSGSSNNTSLRNIAHQWKPSIRMTLENKGKRTPTRIWALKALDDGTVVSGDSMGNVQFWDGLSGALVQSFEHNMSKADVLDLAVSLDQSKVMACGIDSKVTCMGWMVESCLSIIYAIVVCA